MFNEAATKKWLNEEENKSAFLSHLKEKNSSGLFIYIAVLLSTIANDVITV